LAYILGEQPQAEPDESVELRPGAEPACFICQCAGSSDDRNRLVVSRGRQTITILNRYPYNTGHLLVAPQHHHARLDQLADNVLLELARDLARTVGLLERVLRPEGFNVGLNLGRPAGAGLPDHLHWHVVPRWASDTNFMPVMAGVRIIPQSLDALWEALKAELAG
jgi:ATP adenylyltransferase